MHLPHSCSMIFIFVCRSVKFLDLLLLLGVTLLSVFLFGPMFTGIISLLSFNFVLTGKICSCFLQFTLSLEDRTKHNAFPTEGGGGGSLALLWALRMGPLPEFDDEILIIKCSTGIQNSTCIPLLRSMKVISFSYGERKFD